MPSAPGRFVVLLLTVSVLAGCGGGGDNESATTTADTTTTTSTTTIAAEPAHTNADWATVASDPDPYKGETVMLVGRVFSVERTEDLLGLQVWMDPKNSELNTAVAYRDPNFRVAEDDYVRVKGSVGGKVEGENLLGAKLTIPLVNADTLEIVDATAAAPPAYTTYGPVTSTQGQIRMTVTKIEAAQDETRVYVTVNNKSASDFSFYSSSAKLVANGRSIKSSYSGDYDEPASDVAAHSRTSGVILFEEVPRDAALRLILEGYSDNSDVGKYGALTWT